MGKTQPKKYAAMFGNRFAAKDEPRNKQITIRLTERELEALKKAADAANVKPTQIARDTIINFLDITGLLK